MKEGWDVRSGGVWAPVLPSLGGGKTREGLGLGLGVEERVRVKKTSGEKQKECLDFSSQHLATEGGQTAGASLPRRPSPLAQPGISTSTAASDLLRGVTRSADLLPGHWEAFWHPEALTYSWLSLHF